ncbi:hypothetical protein MEZE111188_12000 [Mesobacillus zeae]
MEQQKDRPGVFSIGLAAGKIESSIGKEDPHVNQPVGKRF